MRTVWLFRVLPWVLFVPSVLAVEHIGSGWGFVLGIANGGFAGFCGFAAARAKELAEWYK